MRWMIIFAASAFILSSSAWASTSSCPDQNKNQNQNQTTEGCNTTSALFSNTPLVATDLIFQNTNVFAYQQTANSPCIYDNSSCNNGGFPTIVLNGDTNKDNVVSQNYTVQQLLNVLTVPQFFVGIDVNSTGDHGSETLVRFDMLVNRNDGNGFVLTYTLPGSNALLVGNNPGNGYSDDLIKGFSLVGLNSTDVVQFIMSEHFDVAGREQFFLIGNVPEPATIWLMGSALALLGLFAWRRNRAAA